MELSVEKNEINIKEAIIHVIVFFDLFDFPLTAFEVWKYLGIKCELAEVMATLDEIITAAQSSEERLCRNQNVNSPQPPFTKGGNIEAALQGDSAEVKNKEDLTLTLSLQRRGEMIDMKDGFYFLTGREKIVDIRSKRYNFADKKFKRAVFISKIFKLIPWIKMIAVGNIMGGNNAKQDSDIDLFIITENKRVWLTRFFCVTVTKLFGLRPQGNRMRDTICLSFFVSETAMDLQRLMLDTTAAQSPRGDCAGTSAIVAGSAVDILPEPNVNSPLPPFAKGDNNEMRDARYEHDIYFIYWLACLEPVFDKDNVYKKFIQANNWIYEILPNWESFVGTHWRDAGRPMSFFCHDLIDLFFSGLEKYFKKLQIRILPIDIKDVMNKDVRVVVTDDVLKFHMNDRREYYRKMFEEKLKIV